jgi:hypothetical protein
MILEVNNPLQIPSVLSLAKLIPDTNAEKVKKLLIECMTKRIAKILLAKIDGGLVGLLFAVIAEFDGDDAVFIQKCYIHPHAKEVGREMLAIINKWGVENKVKDIYMATTRSPKTYERKYKFMLDSFIMKRRVSYG